MKRWPEKEGRCKKLTRSVVATEGMEALRLSLLLARRLPGVIMPLAKIGKLKGMRFHRVKDAGDDDCPSSLTLGILSLEPHFNFPMS